MLRVSLHPYNVVILESEMGVYSRDEVHIGVHDNLTAIAMLTSPEETSPQTHARSTDTKTQELKGSRQATSIFQGTAHLQFH